MHELLDLKQTQKKVFLDFGDIKLKILPETFENLNLVLHESYNVSNIVMEDKINELYYDCLKKLQKKFISIYECRHYLLDKHEIDDTGVEKVINKLINNGFLNDLEYAKLSVLAFEKEYYGKYHILNELRKKGIGQSVIEELNFTHERELEKAQTYFKLISNKYASNNYAKQKLKIYNELLKHGFDIDIISDIVKRIPLVADKEIEKLHRDYYKIKSKLGIYETLTELNEGRIISALIKKGYSYRDIIELITEEKEHD